VGRKAISDQDSRKGKKKITPRRRVHRGSQRTEIQEPEIPKSTVRTVPQRGEILE
jgi:hypothetical protein